MNHLHWNCDDCGAHGYSNSLKAERVIVGRHQEDGHTVTVWMRGFKDRAEKWGPIVAAALTPQGNIE